MAFISEILPEAAALINRKKPKQYSYTYRKGYFAEADRILHEFITNSIGERFSDDAILGEEGKVLLGNEKQTHFNIWILDPICGTMNYLYGIPFYVHSLSVMDKDGVLYAGIYDSNRNEMFLADRSRTMLNGTPVRTSQTKVLDEGLIALNSNQSAWVDERPTITELVNRFAPPVTRRIHIFESANLELAYVACGRLDGYVNPHDKIWDMAAGSLMIGSAGGKTRVLKGSISDLSRCKGIIASNEFLIEHLLTMYEDYNEFAD